MDKNTIIKEILIQVLKLNPAALPKNISIDEVTSWDSMSHMSIIAGLENEFGIFIEADDAVSLNSLERITSYINKTI